MTIYIKKIYNYLNNNESKYFILAAKTASAGHHILDLDRDLKISKIRILHKKVKFSYKTSHIDFFLLSGINI